MTNENIESIKDRVSALLRKASDSAATEAEAEAAMRLAQKLMAKYQVTEADLDKGGNAFKEYDRESKWSAKKNERYLHPIERYCAVIVGRFCGVKPYTAADNDGNLVLRLFGLDSDVELANWMLTAFIQQFETDWEIYKNFQLGTKRLVTIKDARKSFAHGFTQAINKRLEDWMFRKCDNVEQNDGTALVVRKLDLVEQKLRESGVFLSAGRHRGDAGSNSGARSAGFMAGSRAETGRGVGKSAIAIGRN
jgi:hypothetical protein